MNPLTADKMAEKKRCDIGRLLGFLRWARQPGTYLGEARHGWSPHKKEQVHS